MRQKIFQLIAFVAIAANAAPFDLAARAQLASAASHPVDHQESGIRFQIKVSVKAVPSFPKGKRDDDRSRASLDVKLRISAHATESNYFGVVTESFSDFRVTEGSDERLFWQDARCHQRRGLPKAIVTAIDGSIRTENGQVEVAARPRYLGKLLPSDEISAGTRLPGGIDKDGPFIAFNSQTNKSHLAVDVKVYTIDCLLTGAAP